MSLIKNGRFNDGFYTEAEVKIKRSDTSELLMAIRQAFAYIGIDQKRLDAMVEKIDPTIRQKRLPLPQKEEWKEYVKSASGSGLYVSIIKNKNNTYTIERSKDKTMFMAPDGIGGNYCNIFIAPDTPMQSLRNDLILNYFDIAGAGLSGASIVSIIPASFVATKTKNIYTLNTTGIIETAVNQSQQPVQPQPQNQTQQPAPQTPPATAQAQQPAPAASANDQTEPESDNQNPPIQDKQAAGTGQNPQAVGTQDAVSQTQPNTLDELAKQEHIKMTKTIQEIQQLSPDPKLNFKILGRDNMLVGGLKIVNINNQRYRLSCYYPNFEQLDKLINLKSIYSSSFDVPENLIDLVKSGKIKSISPCITISYNPDKPIVVVKGVFNT